MLVTRYQTRFVRPPNPCAQYLRCYAQPDGDLSEVLPYLNTRLKGHEFCPELPSLTLKYRAKMITLTAHEIAINIVKDQAEAEEVLEWLRQEINDAWERRGEIVPSFEVAAPPRIFEIFKILPHTNCRACGQPTCMVFAVQVSQGAQGFTDCPHLDQENRRKLREYLRQFHLPSK